MKNIATALMVSAVLMRGGMPGIAQTPTDSPANQVVVSTVGNFNAHSQIHLDDYPSWIVISSNRSSAGVGADSYWCDLFPHNCVGLSYTENLSDGKLVVEATPQQPAQQYIWPLRRWDLSIPVMHRFDLGNFAPFVDAGPGVVGSNGGKTSGISAGFALRGGGGIDLRMRRFTIRLGLDVLETKSGCYDDHTCHAAWAPEYNVKIGVVHAWGQRKRR